MVYNDEFTLSLMQNEELLNINQHSHAGRELYRKGNEIVWAANGDNGEYYLAQFNLGESMLRSSLKLTFAGIESPSTAKDLWNGIEVPTDKGEIISEIPPHGVRLYKIMIHN